MMAWFAPLVGIATAICALELLLVRHAFADTGVFAWPVLRRELAHPALGDLLFSYRGTCALLGLQLAAAILIVASGVPGAPAALAHPAAAWVAWATTLAIAVRFRGTYNGGSDAMLLIVLGVLAIVRTAPGTALAEGALAYAAAQLVLSYFIAGIAKLQDPAWRHGRALPILVTLPPYRVPPWIARVLSHRVLARVLTYAMLAFELAAPIALLHPTACTVILAIGALFHVGNAVVFGLDRFLWTWLAAYPALIHWASGRG